MNDNYPKAYKEVVEILKFVPIESVNKIPKTMLDTLKNKMDNNYDFKINVNKSFEEQDLLAETKAILANIFRDYWATPYQRERILAKENYDRQKIEEEKRIKYNLDKIFDNREKKTQPINIMSNKNKESQRNNNLPISVERSNFFQKLINFFKKLFHLEKE